MTNTVLLKGDGIHKEAVAGGAITPGHLISRTSTNTVVVHATAAGKALTAFALENELVGKGITTAYAANDKVPYLVPVRGSEINALVAAGAPAIAAGDLLESAGDGTLRKYVPITSAAGVVAAGTVDVGAAFAQATLNANFASVDSFISKYSGSVIAVAMEAVDNSGGATAVRIKVEVL